jgi:T-complex protein 11
MQVHMESILNIVSDFSPDDFVPETLMFDVNRLYEMRREFQYICSASSVLVTASSRCVLTKELEEVR